MIIPSAMADRKHRADPACIRHEDLHGHPGNDISCQVPVKDQCPDHVPVPSYDRLKSITGRHVWIESYGCTYNERDAEMLAAVLEDQGCLLVSRPEEADLVVINTCTVTAATDRAMMRRVRENLGRETILTGCLPIARKELVRQAGGPGVVFPRDVHAAFDSLESPPHSHSGIVQVAEGCNGNCSYCITRFARGRVKSIPLERVGLQVRSAVAAGVAEIRLTGQDVAAYGLETPTSFLRLLASVVSQPGDFMVRVGMMNPASVMPFLHDLPSAWDHPKVFRFLHLPVQSGSARVLERMNRGYSADDVKYIVQEFRDRMPDLFLMTDVICGFPGETEDDFSETCELVRNLKPDKVNITRFSKRPGTPAAQLRDFPDRIKKDRSRALQRLAEGIYHEKNAGIIGSVVPVIVTEVVREGSVTCRTPAYRGVVVRGRFPVGTRMNVRVLQDRTYFFTGEPADAGTGT